MAKAVWNGEVIAESSDTVIIEGNHYFPPGSIHREFFRDSQHHTSCPFKGTASYYDIEVNGKTNAEAAWYYPTPKESVLQIKDHIAFWKGVEVQ